MDGVKLVHSKSSASCMDWVFISTASISLVALSTLAGLRLANKIPFLKNINPWVFAGPAIGSATALCLFILGKESKKTVVTPTQADNPAEPGRAGAVEAPDMELPQNELPVLPIEIWAKQILPYVVAKGNRPERVKNLLAFKSTCTTFRAAVNQFPKYWVTNVLKIKCDKEPAEILRSQRMLPIRQMPNAIGSICLTGKKQVPGQIDQVAYSPTRQHVATGSTDGKVKVWDCVDGSFTECIGHSDNVTCLTFSKNGQAIASGSRDGNVIIWNVNTCDQLAGFANANRAVYSAVFSADDSLLYFGSCGGDIVKWSLGAHFETLQGHNGAVSALAYSGRDSILVSGGADALIRLWDQANNSIAVLVGHTKIIVDLAFSKDESRLASASEDGTAIIWNMADRQKLHILREHTNRLTSLHFSPLVQNLLVTTSRDGSLKFWNCENELFSLKISEYGWADSVRFSPDGTTLAVAREKRLYLLDALPKFS